MGIVRFALRFPHTFYVLAALILFLGVIAIRSMPADIFPQIDIPDGDHDRLLVGSGRRLDMRRIALHEDEQAALGAGMFERDRHQGFDQSIENDLCGNSLRGFDHRSDV
jgi:hypothetical protein